jgi:hypothetical protein
VAPMTGVSIACLINDTSDWYHWGCYGTSRGLLGLIERTLQPAVTATVPINFSYAPSYLPESPAALRDSRSAVQFLKSWPAAHALLEASDIVINLEGTIHGTSEVARRLLYIAFLSSRFLGKRVYLVNGSLFPPSDNIDGLDLYRLACASAHHLAVRESHSARLAHDLLGREASLAFDCLPLGLAEANLKPKADAPSYAIVTGASGLDNAGIAILRAGASLLARNGQRLIWLLGAPKQPAADEQSQATHFAPAIGAEIVTAHSFEEWARLIRDARFVLSGRFHYVIARLCLGGPFAAFGGNTPKITSMLGDLGLTAFRIGSPPELVSVLVRAAAATMPPRLVALAEAASLNLVHAKGAKRADTGRKVAAGKPDPCVFRTSA